MPDTLPLDAAPDTGASARDLAVASVESTIVDVPTVRRHKLSQTSVTAQSYVLVRVRLANGAEGIGEAATLGGPRWSEESVEAIKANIDAYLAPAVAGLRADLFEAAGLRMDQAAKRNNAAKAAVETALFDAVGKTLGLPASALLGGALGLLARSMDDRAIAAVLRNALASVETGELREMREHLPGGGQGGR